MQLLYKKKCAGGVGGGLKNYGKCGKVGANNYVILTLKTHFQCKFKKKLILVRVSEPPDFRRLRLRLRPFKNKTAPAPAPAPGEL